MIKKNTVRVRFAPSPTGHLHIGGLRSALFNWLFARHYDGIFVVRVEDTDVARSKPEYVASILNSMQWMGLHSDELIVYQMARMQEHQSAAQALIEKGLAYPCFCEPREAENVISDLEQGRGCRYPGTCRNKSYTKEDLQKPHAVRFRVPDDLKSVAYEDLVLGRVVVDADQCDDFVIIRRDGTPIYNFCVVVDDVFMRITHVIRGQDHVSNTYKQILLYRALEFEPPLFAHIPLILGANGGKLSKRDASVSVEEYRAQGFLPEALGNYLVRLGWSHGDQEIFTRQEMIDYFTLENVGKKGAVFDMKKLQWMNGHYLRVASNARLRDAINDMCHQKYEQACSLWQAASLDSLLDLYKQRATSLIDIADGIVSFADDAPHFEVSQLDKWKTPKMRTIVELFLNALLSKGNGEPAALMEVAKNICDEHGEKLVSLAQPLRLALTGGLMSPGVFELIEILGIDRASKRIERLLEILL